MTAVGWLIIAVGLIGYLLFIWRMIGAGNCDDPPAFSETAGPETIELFPEPAIPVLAWSDRLDELVEAWIGDLPDDWDQLNELGWETERLLDRARRALKTWQADESSGRTAEGSGLATMPDSTGLPPENVFAL